MSETRQSAGNPCCRLCAGAYYLRPHSGFVRLALVSTETPVTGLVLTSRSSSPRGHYERVNLPRFGRHPRSHESAVGVCHGQTQAADIHDGVQGPDGAAGPGEWQVGRGSGPGARSGRDSGAALGAAGGGRRGPGEGRGTDDGGAGGARAPAAREPDPADGAGHPKKSDGGFNRSMQRRRRV
jgi:hypothetical protein